MSNFRKYEEYTLTLLEGLTFLREEKNSLGTKIDQKKDFKHLVEQKYYLESKLEENFG